MGYGQKIMTHNLWGLNLKFASQIAHETRSSE